MTEHLRIQLFLPGLLVRGIAPEVNARRRLVDVLNNGDEILKLKGVSIFDWPSLNPLGEAGEMVIEKRWVYVARPEETDEHRREQRTERAGMVLPGTSRTPIMCLIPPLVIVGLAYLPQGFIPLLRADATVFKRFFPITGASLSVGSSVRIGAEVLILNRDLMAGVTRLPDQQQTGGLELSAPPSEDASLGVTGRDVVA